MTEALRIPIEPHELVADHCRAAANALAEDLEQQSTKGCSVCGVPLVSDGKPINGASIVLETIPWSLEGCSYRVACEQCAKSIQVATAFRSRMFNDEASGLTG